VSKQEKEWYGSLLLRNVRFLLNAVTSLSSMTRRRINVKNALQVANSVIQNRSVTNVILHNSSYIHLMMTAVLMVVNRRILFGMKKTENAKSLAR